MSNRSDHTSRTPEERSHLRSRRHFLKTVGATTAVAAGLGGGAVPAAASQHETITVEPGVQGELHVGDGEILENILIDISAEGADARIVATGSDWVIRNVGFVGTADRSAAGPTTDEDGFPALIEAAGIGLIDHVYLGDGVADDGIRKSAIHVPESHIGDITIRETYVAGWSDNGLDASAPAQNPVAQGSITVNHSYFRNNNLAHLRLAANDSMVSDTVIHNAGDVPDHPTENGLVYSRGIYADYGSPNQTVTVKNSHIDITAGNTNGTAIAAMSYGSTIQIQNSEMRGMAIGNIKKTNTGSNPDLTPPENVPLTANEAALGISGITGPEATDRFDNHRLRIVGDKASPLFSYEITIDGDVTAHEEIEDYAADPDDIVRENDDGTVTISGMAGLGRGDTYSFTGEIIRATVNAPDDQYTIILDGEAVTVEALETGGYGKRPYPGLSKKLLIDGRNTTSGSSYEVTVDGQIAKDPITVPPQEMTDVVQGQRVVGIAEEGGIDIYWFEGVIEDVSIDGPATATVIESDRPTNGETNKTLPEYDPAEPLTNSSGSAPTLPKKEPSDNDIVSQLKQYAGSGSTSPNQSGTSGSQDKSSKSPTRVRTLFGELTGLLY